MDWNGKPYHSLDYEMKRRFGTKVYKIALEGGMTCPNRDGTIGTGGCIFCSAGGSGDFAVPLQGAADMTAGVGAEFTGKPDTAPGARTNLANEPDTAPGTRTNLADEIRATAHFRPTFTDGAALEESVHRQIDLAISRISRKMGSSPGAYIVYFQSYTNTYAPVSYLRQLFTAAILHPEIRVLSIATRPDCLPEEVLDLLEELNQIKPVWIELGLQTIHPDTARLIRRGYELDCFTDAKNRLRRRGLEVIVHVILGLPGEDRTQMLETVSWLGSNDIQGIKLQLLHILKGTDLALLYEQAPFPVMSMEEYLDLVIDCVSLLPPEIVIHRITGDGPKNLLIAPLWSANKRLVLNTLTRRFQERGITQGCHI